MSSCKVRPRAQVCESSAAVEMRHWRRRIANKSGQKKECVPCVSVHGRGVPVSSYTVEMSCTYMASCVAAGQGECRLVSCVTNDDGKVEMWWVNSCASPCASSQREDEDQCEEDTHQLNCVPA